MKSVMLCLTTAPDAATAKSLSTGLLNARLAACVTTLPGAESMYWWEGKLEASVEFVLLIKTTADLTDPLKQFITAHHPYDTPELLCLPIADGLEKYLKWVQQETKQ
jgi:periplasmic divalent cation tolerance protein